MLDEGVPQTLVSGDRVPGQVMFDLDGDTPLELLNPEGIRKLVSKRMFDAEVALHFTEEQRMCFYDTNNDGQFDIILLDDNIDDRADKAFARNGNGQWIAHDNVSQWLIDPRYFKNKELGQKFIELIRSFDQ